MGYSLKKFGKGFDGMMGLQMGDKFVIQIFFITCATIENQHEMNTWQA